MRRANVLAGFLAVAALQQAVAASNEDSIPYSCPVTRSTPETRFTPPLPDRSRELSDATFWFGSDSLYTHLSSDGRWRGIKSHAGTRNKLFLYRKDAEWLMEKPYQLVVTAMRLDGDQQVVRFPRTTIAIMGEVVAMLLILELPKRGCWQVTANYKSDYLSFVTWLD